MKKILFPFLCFLLFLQPFSLSFPQSVHGELSGTLVSEGSQDEVVWSKEHSPYILKGNVTFSKLIIEPGVEVIGNGYNLNFTTDSLKGTPELPIKFVNSRIYLSVTSGVEYIDVNGGFFVGTNRQPTTIRHSTFYKTYNSTDSSSYYDNKIVKAERMTGVEFEHNIIDQAAFQIYEIDHRSMKFTNNLLISNTFYSEGDSTTVEMRNNTILDSRFTAEGRTKFDVNNNYWSTGSISEVKAYGNESNFLIDELLIKQDPNTPQITDVTKVNKFTSGDRVMTGKTVPNAYVAITSTASGDGFTRSIDRFPSLAKADENGDFKLYTGNFNPNQKIKLFTLSSIGETLDIDSVFVYKASLNPYFNPITTSGELFGSTDADTKIEILKDGEVIFTTLSKGEVLKDIPKYPAGTFLTFRLTKGSVVKTYEQMVQGAPFSTYPVTNWSNTMEANTLPNAKIEFYQSSNRSYSRFGQNIKIHGLTATKDGNYTLPFAENGLTPAQFNKSYVYVLEPKFENVVYQGYFTLKSTAPVIEPISQLSQTVTGSATPGSAIEVFDEEGEKLGDGKTSNQGIYSISVKKLAPDTFITVHSFMAGTNKMDESIRTVEEVYVADVADNSDTISGESTFGTSAEVFVEPASMFTKSSSQIQKAATTKVKKYGPFSITKGKTFKLKTGKLPAGSKVQVVLMESKKKLTLPKKTVKDKTKPTFSRLSILTSKSKTFSGYTEPSATVYITIGKKKYKVKSKTNGSFNFKISGLKKGTKGSIYAIDLAKNKSASKSLIVK